VAFAGQAAIGPVSIHQEDAMQHERPESSKRVYHRPSLKIYGGIRELTETSSYTGQKNDGGGKEYSKAKTG